MFIPVLHAVAFERFQPCAENLELFDPETHAQTSTNETLSIEHV